MVDRDSISLILSGTARHGSTQSLRGRTSVALSDTHLFIVTLPVSSSFLVSLPSLLTVFPGITNKPLASNNSFQCLLLEGGNPNTTELP